MKVLKEKVKKLFLALVMITALLQIMPINNVKAEEIQFTEEDFPYNIEITSISSTFDHVLAIDSSNNLWQWGGTGRLNDLEEVYVPTQVLPGIKFVKASAGLRHSLAIDESGDLYAWGINTYGQIGNGTTIDVETPVKILEGTKFKEAYALTEYSIAVDINDNIWAWGRNDYGQLGDGTTNSRTTPLTILGNIKPKQIYVSGFTVMVIDQSNKLWGWGYGSEYLIPTDSDSIKVLIPTPIMEDKQFSKLDVYTGIRLYSFPDSIFIDIPYFTGSYAADFNISVSEDKSSHILAIDTQGSLWSWGRNDYGQLGDGTTTDTSTPIKIMDNVIDISVDGSNSYAIDASKKLYAWGPINEKNTPVEFVLGRTFVKICKTMAIDTNGFLWGWSESNFGVSEGDESVPTVIRTDKKFKDILCPGYLYRIVGNIMYNGIRKFSLCINSDGNLWGAGYNRAGQLATSISNEITELLQITELGSQYTVTFMNGTETVSTQIVAAGQAATEPSISKPGYILSWDEDFSNVTSDLTVRAIWTAKTDTPYRVEHYFRTTDREVESYALLEVENLGGTTDSIAVAVAKNNPGFTENTTHPDRVPMGTVAVDGSLVLKLYYDRNTYKVTLDPNGGTINSGNVTEYVYGMGVTLPTDLTKTGYSFIHWWNEEDGIVSQIPTTAIGDKEYIAVWYIIDYLVVFKDGDTECSRGTYHYGDSAVAPELTKAGYTLSWDKDFSCITSPLTVNAVWTPNTNTPYKIKYYIQNTTLDGYGVREELSLTGTTDEEVTAIPRMLEGFTENTTHPDRVAMGTVTGDGSLVLKLYYDRNTYKVTLDPMGGTINSGNVTEYVYGIGTTLPTDLTKTGYSFMHWWNEEDGMVSQIPTTATGDKEYIAVWYIIDYLVVFKDGDTECSRFTYHYGDSAVAPELTKAGYTLSWDKDFSYITSPLTVNAVWTANTNTSYKVEHYLRNLDTEVEGYDLKETENLTGTTDTQVTALAKTYEGFTENTTYSDRLITGTIAGDGSLVLKLYYDRNSYNINYELNGGTATGTLTSTYLYGKELILSNKVEKQGYIFAGWYSNSTLTGNKITTIGETETGNKTFYAKWIKEDEYYITSVKYEIGEEYITKVSPYTSVSTFLSNINTNGTVKVLNANQQEVIGDAFVGTGYILQVEFDGTTYEYEIVVRGDIDGNGKITVTDLSMLNQTIVRRITLTGAREKAADIDYSGKISITDLSMLNQTIVGRITL